MTGLGALKICAAILVGAICFSVVKKVYSGFELPMKITATVVFFGAVLALAVPLFSYVGTLMSGSSLADWQTLLFGAFGTALVSHVTAELCRDCGENSLAGFAELAGKVEILVLCLPLVKAVLEEVEALVG